MGFAQTSSKNQIFSHIWLGLALFYGNSSPPQNKKKCNCNVLSHKSDFVFHNSEKKTIVRYKLRIMIFFFVQFLFYNNLFLWPLFFSFWASQSVIYDIQSIKNCKIRLLCGVCANKPLCLIENQLSHQLKPSRILYEKKVHTQPLNCH